MSNLKLPHAHRNNCMYTYTCVPIFMHAHIHHTHRHAKKNLMIPKVTSYPNKKSSISLSKSVTEIGFYISKITRK